MTLACFCTTQSIRESDIADFRDVIAEAIQPLPGSQGRGHRQPRGNMDMENSPLALAYWHSISRDPGKSLLVPWLLSRHSRLPSAIFGSIIAAS